MTTKSFAGHARGERLQSMTEKNYDVLIIGGGITGAGIALDATARGMKAALVEMQDFAAGTSSRSTKLVHGGLRYLKQFEVKMVAEVGKERAIVYENGPHVTIPERMLLPMHKGGTFGKFSTSIGLQVYDRLAGVKHSERRRMHSARETLDKEPLLKRDGLKGGGSYVEYRTDDARMTIEVMKKAAQTGADLVNYARVERLLYNNGQVVGAHVRDQITGEGYDIHATVIINAAGPWVDTLREMDGSKKGKMLQLTKGVHLVFDQKRFPLRQAIYFDTPDGRMIFAIPREGKTYVGTTDTVYKEDTANPRMTLADRNYIMNAIAYMFPDVKLTLDDVESSWAGVRPLIYEEGKDPSEISRRDEIWESASGLVTIAGGKLTGYRKMAEMVMDRVSTLLTNKTGESWSKANTKQIKMSGGDVGGSAGFEGFVQDSIKQGNSRGIAAELSEQWARRYGSNIARLFELAARPRQLASEQELPDEIRVPLLYALEEEMAVTPVDFFIRRTGAIFFRIDWVRKWKSQAIDLMAEYYQWSIEERQQHTERLETELYYAVEPVDADITKVAGHVG
ncbi:glycerol-3-phosphate dehydrogenase/oxidase [Paenibacillus massiliensis]|uniref:glycerol-3-phosphate dehydrogenase/oxidase n=1 Tax=Paenibacillus massiliensis TaxID=225917 RepID=UPI00046F34F2|nr:FAD-dependent oxidoreductase [Paenibacillus massiliensis]